MPASRRPALGVLVLEARYTPAVAHLASALADLTGDGVSDAVVTESNPGGSLVRVLDGADREGRPILAQFPAFEAGFTGTVNVAAAALPGGEGLFVIAAGEGGGPRVRVFRLTPAGVEPRADFFGLPDPAFRGGATVALGDFDGDGTPDLAIGAGLGGGPRVAVYDGRSVMAGNPSRLTGDFWAFPDPATVGAFRGGVFVAAGDLNQDGRDDLVFGAGDGGSPRIRIVSGYDVAAGGTAPSLLDFVADPEPRDGARVSVGQGELSYTNGIGDMFIFDLSPFPPPGSNPERRVIGVHPPLPALDPLPVK